MDIRQIGIGGELPLPEVAKQGGTPPPGGVDFSKVLHDSVGQLKSMQQEADSAIQSLATGGGATIHDTMLAMEKAGLAFKLMMQVRNKIIEAYQEVIRMSV